MIEQYMLILQFIFGLYTASASKYDYISDTVFQILSLSIPVELLILKKPSKIAADDTFIFIVLLSSSNKIRLDVSFEFSGQKFA